MKVSYCFWLAYARWLLQGKVAPSQIRCEAKKQICKFYNLTKKQYDTFIIEYKGFDVVNELNKLIINAKINVNIFYYDNDDKFYYLGERRQYNKIKLIKTDDNDETEEEEQSELLPTFNILLVSDTHESQSIYHVFHVTNTDGLTRQKYCPHCYKQSFDPKDDHYERDYEQHVSQCKINGRQIIKKVKLDEQPFPYIPHIQRNETYAYLLANNATQQFKPTHYYITYDFETVERKVNSYFGKPLNKDNQVIRNSQWISVLEPLSVASTIKLKWIEQYNNDNRYKKIVTPFGQAALKNIYFDLRQGDDFITQWIEQVFEEAKQVSLDNKYDNQDIPYKQNVSIIGFNSSRFDQALFSKYLHNDKWTIQSYIGTLGQGKQIVVEHKQTKLQINFIDAMNYTQPTDLANFAKDFGNKVNESKGLFPYEGITYDNYNYELNKSQPFPIKAFDSMLKNKTMTDDDYLSYTKDAINYATSWDYLQHYNELDTQIMIQPLDNLINWFNQYNVDMLSFMSLAANANAIKYAIAYKYFDLNVNYPQQSKKSMPFILSQSYWNSKVIVYNIQDKQKHRRTNNNVTINDNDHYKDLFERSACVICGDKFTMDNKPTLDGIDNRLPHIKSIWQPCCLYCNRYKSDQDEKITKLFIQLRRYCNINHLPQTLVNNEVYQLIRRNITGGLSNVMHRYNHANETTIKRYYYNEDNKTITVIDTYHTVSHICGVDFNSLYPSCFSSQYHPFNKYTNGIMYMCRSVTSVINDPIQSRKIINSADRFTDKGQLFIAQLKGHIDENYINDFINFPQQFATCHTNQANQQSGNI
ncbi:MAG: hypothetical protein EZS28_035524 [Streblomastix strix]|uniref:Uncharacterized protein n=1 Tax=Streblomastix strix TaxID=222440 RepID=A0A5J4UE70_9EUKA|nr:MAG: hypothetical protein EZS28_035524 [Streblomastix strix]